MNIGKSFETGVICNEFTAIESTSIDFIPHKAFNGVSLKHLVKGEKTNNQLSCHLVKVEPFCSLETHVHADNLEIHEIIYGDGECQIAENKVKYNIGVVGVIPQNTKHKVTAGKDGLYILAKFSPALL